MLLPIYKYKVTPKNRLLITMFLPKSMPELALSKIEKQENLIDLFNIEANDQNFDIKANFTIESKSVTFEVMSSKQIQNFKISIVPKYYHIVSTLEVKPSISSAVSFQDLMLTESTSDSLRMVQSSTNTQLYNFSDTDDVR